jgi:PPP family 3-phenylpropionic acid transporter
MPAARAPRIRPAVAVQTLFILFGVVIAAYFPFLSMFLDSKGLTAGQIGGVIAGMAVARVILSPMWGHLADTTIGRRRALQIGAVGGAAAALALFAAESDPAIWATAIALAGVSATIAPNVDAIALGFLGDRMGDYGRMRGWESLSYATACLLFGIVLQQVGVRWDMPILAGAALVVFFWTIVAIEPDRPLHRIRHGRLGAVGAVFRAAPRFWIFLVALLLVWTGFNAAWNFIGLRIERAGGGPFLLGAGAALGGLVEVPVMRLSSRLSNRLGLRPVFVTGCLVYAFGFLLWGLVEDPTLLSVLTVFEGAGFALLFTTMVVVIGRMLPSTLYSTGQSLAATMGFGIAPIIGAGIGGLVFDRYGPATLYVGASLLTLCGAAVAWLALSTPALSRPAASHRGLDVRWPETLTRALNEEVEVVSAFILIQTEVGRASNVTREIGGVTGIVSVDPVTGPYDVIARGEASDLDELAKAIVMPIQSVEGVTRTLTCPVLSL